MITFLLLNTSGLCMIPTLLISLRKEYGSTNPVFIIPYIIVVSLITTFFSMYLDKMVTRNGKN